MTIASELIRRVYFVYLDIAGDPVRVNNSDQSLYWDGHEWLGVGALGDLSEVVDNTDMSATQMTLTIQDVPLDHINALDDADYQERNVNIWQADLNAANTVTSSVLVWVGRMDSAAIEVGNVGAIQMSCEGSLARWNMSAPRRMNDQTQQRLHPGDRGFQYVAASASIGIQL